MTAVRYLIGYDGPQLRVVQRRPVDAVAPLPADLAAAGSGPAARSGFWCELRDLEGTVLYRQVLRDPRHPTAEVHGGLAAQGAGSVHVARPPTGILSLLVPDLPAAQQVCLVACGLGDPAPHDLLVIPADGRDAVRPGPATGG